MTPRRPMWLFCVILAVALLVVWGCWWGITRVAWDDCQSRDGNPEPVYGTSGWTCNGANPP